MPSAQALWRAGLAAHVTQPVTIVNTAVTSRLSCNPGRSAAPYLRFPGAAQHRFAFPGRSAVICVSRAQRSTQRMRSGALQTRDRHRLEPAQRHAWEGPGSAVHRFASLHAAPRPGNVTLFVSRAQRSAVSAFPGRGAASYLRFPGAAQRGTKWSGALPTRDRHRLRALGTGAACAGPGSAVHHFVLHRIRGTSFDCLAISLQSRRSARALFHATTRPWRRLFPRSRRVRAKSPRRL